MWPFGSVLFLVLVGSPVSGTSGLKTITVKAGENVILPCRDPNINQVSVLEWNRTDLQENEYVFFYRSGEPFLAGQPESFKNRVFLKNNQTKDGDLSVVLKNLKIEDSGTYKSRVLKTGTKISLSQTLPICSIHLVVSPPDPKIISAEPGEDIILPSSICLCVLQETQEERFGELLL
ncbi:hypothetical protein OJAV_G00185480 [Oryzias javanicus]|uniref:Ig-like domain-containing protein n=1 Tax=Oryzias javanicus TaxID=123683 RepID=A0A3S2P9I7_ORYJA|nr:hypothetical protein OJAV_G00185480 [Oryzias javanicus]